MALIAFNCPETAVRFGCWQSRVLTGAGLVLLPWLGYLAATLPPGAAAAWVALDAVEAVALLTAGSRLARADGRHRVPAAVAAVLLLLDACVDLATSAGSDLAVAVAMAVVAEVPLAALCAVLAVRPWPPVRCPKDRQAGRGRGWRSGRW